MTEQQPLDLASEIQRQNLEPLRNSIQEHLLKRDDAEQNAEMANANIAELEKQLRGWRRYRDYQVKRKLIMEHRIRADRELLRATEDFESGIEP